MRITHQIASVSLFFIVASAPAVAAQISRLCDLESRRGMGCAISLVGEIKKGDAKKLRQTIIANREIGDPFRFLLLDSPGGDVEEAMRIGDVVKAGLLVTTMVRLADLEGDKRFQRQCVSACFLILLAGGERIILWGKVGVHRPYFGQAVYQNRSPLEIANAQQELESLVRKYARANGASDLLIDKMMERSSKQVYWLTEGETSSIEGEQGWYQELMIAACGEDPARSKRRLVYACVLTKVLEAQSAFAP